MVEQNSTNPVKVQEMVEQNITNPVKVQEMVEQNSTKPVQLYDKVYRNIQEASVVTTINRTTLERDVEDYIFKKIIFHILIYNLYRYLTLPTYVLIFY